MKIRQVVIGLIGLIGLGIAFGVGRYFRPTPLAIHPPDFDIYVRSDPAVAGKCLVTTPIVLMSYTNDRVRWVAEDTQYHQYSVEFINITPPPNYPPIPATTPLTPRKVHWHTMKITCSSLRVIPQDRSTSSKRRSTTIMRSSIKAILAPVYELA
jgi:hypothetical protein